MGILSQAVNLHQGCLPTSFWFCALLAFMLRMSAEIHSIPAELELNYVFQHQTLPATSAGPSHLVLQTLADDLKGVFQIQPTLDSNAYFSQRVLVHLQACDDSFIIPRCVPLTCAQFRCPGNAEDCEEGFSGFPTCVRRECSATKCSKGEQCFVSLDTEAGDHECLPATGVTVPESSEIIEAEDAFNRYLLTKPVSASQAAEECSRFEMQHEDIATQLVFDGVRIVMEAWKNFGRIESGALKEVWVRGTSSARPGARLNSLTYSTMPYPADSRLCVVMSYYHPVDTRTRRVNLYASS